MDYIEKDKDMTKKCIACKYYYHSDGQYCSICRIKKTVDPEVYRKTYCFNQEDLLALFQRYKDMTHLHNSTVSEAKLNMLLCLVREQTPAEVYAILLGYRDFPAVVLTAQQARYMWDALKKRTLENAWRYAHAICPFILDIWNFDEHICRCYYTLKDEWLYPSRDMWRPVLCNDVVMQWYKLTYFTLDRWAAKSVGVFVICDCSICLEPLASDMEASQCSKCKAVWHAKCTADYQNYNDEHASDITCPNCRAAWRY